MRIAIEGPQLTEVNFHQILDIQTTKSQNTTINHNHRIPIGSKNITNLFYDILGGGQGNQPWAGGNPRALLPMYETLFCIHLPSDYSCFS